MVAIYVIVAERDRVLKEPLAVSEGEPHPVCACGSRNGLRRGQLQPALSTIPQDISFTKSETADRRHRSSLRTISVYLNFLVAGVGKLIFEGEATASPSRL